MGVWGRCVQPEGKALKHTNWPTTSRHARGYGIAWDKVRALVLDRDGHLCQCLHCKAEGRVKLATHVDHVVSKAKAKAQGWTDAQIDDPGNLQAINADCHERKGIEEYGGRAKPKRHIGIDGFPIG
jgi:5-methylcytosine-specific restriction protein A